MAYSRWSDSDWYTYWCAEADDGGDPLLVIHYVGDASASARHSDLVDVDVDGLAKMLPEVPREALPELLGYVREFCADVADERAGK